MDIIDILIFIGVWLFGVYCGYGARPQIEMGITLMKMQKEENKRLDAEEKAEKETSVNSGELPYSKGEHLQLGSSTTLERPGTKLG